MGIVAELIGDAQAREVVALTPQTKQEKRLGSPSTGHHAVRIYLLLQWHSLRSQAMEDRLFDAPLCLHQAEHENYTIYSSRYLTLGRSLNRHLPDIKA